MKLGRNMNLQFWIMAALLMFPQIVLQMRIYNASFLSWAIMVMFIDASTIKLVPKENIKKNNSSNIYKASSCQDQNISLAEEGDCKNNFQGPELP
jgi:hypothetical protein